MDLCDRYERKSKKHLYKSIENVYNEIVSKRYQKEPLSLL